MRLALAILICGLVPGTVAAAPGNLYEWIAVAPTVATGKPVGPHGSRTLVQLTQILRGDISPGTTVMVNVGRANGERDRELHKRGLRLVTGESYLLLLRPAGPAKPGSPPRYDLVRGVAGARELPPEGAQAIVAALERFVRVQDAGDDRVVWRGLRGLVEETDPILIQTALEQFLKFRRGDMELLPSLRPILDHPSAELRELSVRLIAQTLARWSAEGFPDAARLRDELVGRARRDSSVAVRIAATEALTAFSQDGLGEILRQIADGDPDQRVRYAAERMLYERNEDPSGSEHGSPEERRDGT